MVDCEKGVEGVSPQNAWSLVEVVVSSGAQWHLSLRGPPRSLNTLMSIACKGRLRRLMGGFPCRAQPASVFFLWLKALKLDGLELVGTHPRSGCLEVAGVSMEGEAHAAAQLLQK